MSCSASSPPRRISAFPAPSYESRRSEIHRPRAGRNGRPDSCRTAEIEALLASDPDAAAEAVELRAFAARLRAEMPGEEAGASPRRSRARGGVRARPPGRHLRRGNIVRFPRRDSSRMDAYRGAPWPVSASLALLFPAMQAEKGRRTETDMDRSKPPATPADGTPSAPRDRPTTRGAGRPAVITAPAAPVAEPAAGADADALPDWRRLRRRSRLVDDHSVSSVTGRRAMRSPRRHADSRGTTSVLPPPGQGRPKRGNKVHRPQLARRRQRSRNGRILRCRPRRPFGQPARLPLQARSRSPQFKSPRLLRGLASAGLIQHDSPTPPPCRSLPQPSRSASRGFGFDNAATSRLVQSEVGPVRRPAVLPKDSWTTRFSRPGRTRCRPSRSTSTPPATPTSGGSSQPAAPPKDAVRIEELINYFPYDDPPPTGDDPFCGTSRWRLPVDAGAPPGPDRPEGPADRQRQAAARATSSS